MNTDFVGKLRAKAWVYANNYRGDVIMPQLQRFELKLAELIVAECLSIVEPMPGSGDEADRALESARQQIKEKFGINE